MINKDLNPKKLVRKQAGHAAVLRHWYHTRPGCWLEDEERRQISAILPKLFGYHLLQVGAPYREDCLHESKIRDCMMMDAEWPDRLFPDAMGMRTKITGLAESLPFTSDSLDVVLLPHTLELTDSPHQVLREVERVLIAEGHVIVLGFNPFGLWMPGRLLRMRKGPLPGCKRLIGHPKLRDWLQLLGFDIVLTRSYFFRPPFAHEGLMRRMQFMERLGSRWWPFFGGAYLLVAKKRVATLTPTRQRWRPRRSRLAAGMAENSFRKSG